MNKEMRNEPSKRCLICKNLKYDSAFKAHNQICDSCFSYANRWM